MWKRLFVYLLIIIALGATWATISSYGGATVDLEKTKMGLNTVNGTDADFAAYQGAQSGVSYIQTYTPWVVTLLAVCITYFIWRKPARDVFRNIKTQV